MINEFLVSTNDVGMSANHQFENGRHNPILPTGDWGSFPGPMLRVEIGSPVWCIDPSLCMAGAKMVTPSLKFYADGIWAQGDWQ